LTINQFIIKALWKDKLVSW